MNFEMLFISDNSQEFYTYRLFLENDGNTVSLRATTSEVEEYLESHEPALAIVDIDTPCTKVQNLSMLDTLYNLNIPIILIVEDIDDHALMICTEEYETIVMQKPIVVNDLMEEINLILDDLILEEA